MEKANYITMNGASFLDAFVHSFNTEKDFINAMVNELKFGNEKDKKVALKQVYKTALKTKPKE